MTKRAKPSRRAAILIALDADKDFVSSRPRWLHDLGGQRLLDPALALCAELEAPPLVLCRAKAAKVLSSELGNAAQVLASTKTSLRPALQQALAKLRKVDELLIFFADQALWEKQRIQDLWAEKNARGQGLALLSHWQSRAAGGQPLLRNADTDALHLGRAASATEQAIEVDAGLWIVDKTVLSKALKAPIKGAGLLHQLVELAKGQVTTSTCPSNESLRVIDRLDLALASRLVQAQRNRALMLSGVTMLDPTTTWVDADCVVEPDVVLGANVQLRGATRVGRGAHIDANVIITDCIIDPDVELRAFSHLEDAAVKRGAIIGPFSRLRPGADIGAQAHIGNFVEVKNATVETGAKANHLAYLGDARIGSGSNIGAGTITCNYDGALKHHTEIGQGVFVGSNSTLVAPITLNDGVYVAAGSTLTQDVPKDALAFGRSRQINKSGVAKKLRARNKQRKQQAKADSSAVQRGQK